MSNKTVIGARSLSEEEVKQILPTYDKVFEQIEDFRKNRNFNTYQEEKDYSSVQKTNNIGIIGCRGAGKTSVLKTISKRIKTGKHNDIILPIIIPENMSESSTLMATILGLFKNIVDRIIEEKAKEKNNLRNCIYEEKDCLEENYNEAVKQYTFIQNDYRNILINQFTTENEYVNKINKVFNSDSEFIKKFNDFIDELIKRHSIEDNSEEKPLIVIFIDDIDLSTRRCGDVVKTLLSYLSNENIVTIISGDLDTFEEALTLEFLRQEKALDNEVMKTKYLGNGQTLLTRKKILSYEYLKKVIPPTYRHNIKYWSLSTKASYSIDINNDKDKMNLGNLLCDVLREYIDATFFKYIDYTSKKESDISEQKYEFDNLPYTYNLFDNTSRGLNNIYNILELIKEKQNVKKDKEIDYSDKKLLIEVIASSKPLYNSYRTQLFENIIQFGKDENSTIIKWDNAGYLFDAMDKEENNSKSNEEKSSKSEAKDYYYESSGEKDKNKFSIFIFIYFSAKLLNKDDFNTEEFNNIKKKIIDILISTPEISESLFRLKNKIELKPYEEDNDFNYKSFNMLSDFLYKSDFELALHLYKYLSNKDFDLSKLDDTDKNDNIYSTKSFSIISLLYALKSYCNVKYKYKDEEEQKKIEEYITEIYNKFIPALSYIQNSFSDDEPKYVLERTLGDTLNSILSDDMIKNIDIFPINEWSRWLEKARKNQYNELILKLIMNSIYQNYTNKIEAIKHNKGDLPNLLLSYIERTIEGIGNTNTDYSKDQNIDDGKESKNIQNEKKRLKLICAILKNDLKSQVLSGKVYDYMKNELKIYVKDISDNLDTINISVFKDNSFENFKGIYKGESFTVADRTETDLKAIIENDEKIKFNDYLEVKKIISKLARNTRVWYGQKEAQHMLQELTDTAFIEFTEKSEFIYMYIYCFIIWNYDDGMNKEHKLIKELRNIISEAQGLNNENLVNEYMDSLNNNIDDKIEKDEFDRLFNF